MLKKPTAPITFPDPKTRLIDNIDLMALVSIVSMLKGSNNQNTLTLESLLSAKILQTLTEELPIVEKEKEQTQPKVVSFGGTTEKPN